MPIPVETRKKFIQNFDKFVIQVFLEETVEKRWFFLLLKLFKGLKTGSGDPEPKFGKTFGFALFPQGLVSFAYFLPVFARFLPLFA